MKKIKKITTKLGRAEQRLHVSEDKYRQLVENVACIILRMDKDGKITFFNEFAQKFYGYTEQEILGKNIIGTIIPKGDSFGQNLAKMARDIKKLPGFYAAWENENTCKNGQRVWVSWANKAIPDEDGNGTEILCVGHDITERRRLEKEILDLTERERELIGQEIHDSIGQILTGIAIKCKGLSLKLKDKASEEMEDALVISKLANKAIAQARDIAKMLYPVDIQTGGLVSALKTLASDVKESLGVTCQFKCGKYVSVKNLIEAKQIYRIVQEAITNAVKHGKATIINISLRLTKKGTVLSIENDGLDFPRLAPDRNGVGLKIMKYRTDLIGGSLDICKRDKGGTIVTVRFLTDDKELGKE
jgi:PAS domain S-box-containing protein